MCCVHFYHRRGSGEGEGLHLRNSPSEIEKLDAIASLEMTDLLIDGKEPGPEQSNSLAGPPEPIGSSSEMHDVPNQVKFARNVS